MFHIPSDVIADHSFNVQTNNEHDSLNLIQLDYPDAIPLSPENTPSSSPASVSCSTISSLKTWQSTSEQLQTPIFSFPDPVWRNFEAITSNSSDELSSRRTSYSQMSTFGVPSTQEPTIPAIDEGELEDLRWTTGVPCHMIDVFHANPFTLMDQPRIAGTTSPPLDNATDPYSAECKARDPRQSRSAAKHILSPDAVEQKRKARTKRARIQSSSAVPFPATGPQEMFAYEFRLDIPHQNTGLSRVERYRRCGDLPRSYPLSRDMDGHEHPLVPRPAVAHRSEDVSLRLPVDREDVGLPLLPSRLSYSCYYTASISQKTKSENYMQPAHIVSPSVPPLTQVPPLCLEDPSNPAVSAPPQGIESRPRFEEYGRSALPPAMPTRVTPERAHTFRPSVITPAAPPIQKPLYACPLCPRDFQLPNGLALHLKWHERVRRLEMNLTSHMNHRSQDRGPPKNPHVGPPQARDMRHPQLPTQDNGQRNTMAGLLTASYTAPQRASSQVESVSRSLWVYGCCVVMADTRFKMTTSGHEQYTTTALSYERQPQECALFHDVLQLDLNSGYSLALDDNTYLAPLDGLSVLQPLPFGQYHLSTGQLCSLPPS